MNWKKVLVYAAVVLLLIIAYRAIRGSSVSQ